MTLAPESLSARYYLSSVFSGPLQAAGGFIQIRADRRGTEITAHRMRFGNPPESLGVIWRSHDAATAARGAEAVAHPLSSGVPWRLVFDPAAMALHLPPPWADRYLGAVAAVTCPYARIWLACQAWEGRENPAPLPPGAVDAVTEWWANHLSSRQPAGRNGDGNVLAIGLEEMARDAVLSRHGHPSAAELARFRTLLGFAVIRERDPGVDYDPCPTLRLAFEFATEWRYSAAAKLLWPFKTMMWLRAEGVAVAEGYRATPRALWGVIDSAGRGEVTP